MILPKLIMDSKATVEADEETMYKAVVDDGRSIKDWVTWFKETNEGKALRGVPLSSGGGATGGNGGGINKKWSEMSGQERTDLYISDPALYRKMKNKG